MLFLSVKRVTTMSFHHNLSKKSVGNFAEFHKIELLKGFPHKEDIKYVLQFKAKRSISLEITTHDLGNYYKGWVQNIFLHNI